MSFFVNIFRSLVNSNIYISLAGVMLTMATQVQLGLQPELHPYLFLIFFATLCEYNVHRFVTIITNKAALESEKHKWVKNNLIGFYFLVFLSVAGFVTVALMAKREVLLGLAPIAVLTLFYSIPVYGNKKSIFRLRGIPYLKIFMIAFTWSTATILLPVIHTGRHYPPYHVILMIVERFMFVFAITIPFDTRDMEADTLAKLKTIPLLLGEKRSMNLAYISVLLFAALSILHYTYIGELYIAFAMAISAITTLLFLRWDRAKSLPLYHYAILDGTMLLQGLLVLIAFYLSR
jgi:4-hydroxybenzoate polyprenyltransferase